MQQMLYSLFFYNTIIVSIYLILGLALWWNNNVKPAELQNDPTPCQAIGRPKWVRKNAALLFKEMTSFYNQISD